MVAHYFKKQSRVYKIYHLKKNKIYDLTVSSMVVPSLFDISLAYMMSMNVIFMIFTNAAINLYA